MRAPRGWMPNASRATAIATLALVTACAPPPGGDTAPEPDSAGAGGPATASVAAEGDLRVALTAGPARARAPIDFTLEVANAGGSEALLDFPDGQRFDFEVLDGGAAVWRWAADMFFPQVLGRERIPPGESIEWSARLEAGLPAGEYLIRGTLTTRPPVEVEVTLTVPESTGDPPP